MKKHLALILIFICSVLNAQISVSTATELQNALNNAKAGQTIVIATGDYIQKGGFVIPKDINGTSKNPIVLTSKGEVILSADDINSGNGLSMLGNSYWIIENITLSNARKGIMMDYGIYNIIQNVKVLNIGDEGIHLRKFSCNNIVKDCFVDFTGLINPGFGEGIYIGSAISNWGKLTDGKPDECNNNIIENNSFGDHIAAENIDIKEGTQNGIIKGNKLNGLGLMNVNYADSWIDVKGNSYIIENNIGNNALLDGIQTNIQAPNWGDKNVFKNNILNVNAKGYGIKVRVSSENGTVTHNIVCNNNIETHAEKGLTNVETEDCDRK